MLNHTHHRIASCDHAAPGSSSQTQPASLEPSLATPLPGAQRDRNAASVPMQSRPSNCPFSETVPTPAFAAQRLQRCQTGRPPKSTITPAVANAPPRIASHVVAKSLILACLIV